MGAAPLKILYVIDYGTGVGGAERFALALATNLPRDRFEPWFCFTRVLLDGPRRELHEANISYWHLGRQAKWDAYRLAGLMRLLRSQQFDVLHTHKFGSNLWGTLMGAAARVPIRIAHEHTWAYEGDPVRAFLDGRVIGRLVTRFVAVSPADAERMVAYERVPADKVVVIPTAYIASPVAPHGDIRAELGIRPDAPMVATAAWLRPQKAIEVLLEAHARVLSRVPDAQLVIAGDGGRRKLLESRARELGLDGHVHFLGIRRDIDAIVAAADVGALSSDYEGMPLFTFECMANRTPLVATAVGGLPSVIDNGSTGILVPPRNPAALSDALTSLLIDPAKRREIADAAAGRLEAFRIETITHRFATMYEDLAKQARRQPS
jgi:glycosyltransferase involved in cell wall biosynthesis